MDLKTLQQDFDIVNESISFWSGRLEETLTGIELRESLGQDTTDLHLRLENFYRKILFESEQLEKIESIYNLYLEKNKKIRRRHFQKSFLS